MNHPSSKLARELAEALIDAHTRSLRNQPAYELSSQITGWETDQLPLPLSPTFEMTGHTFTK